MTVEKLPRPRTLSGRTVRVATGCGNMYVILNRLDGRLFEVFAQLGKSGGCARSQSEALTRSITLGLRCGVPLEAYIKQLDGIACPMPAHEDGECNQSCADALVRVLREYGGVPE